ncbi:MAG: hypothetical protein R6V05_06990 [Candidatus Brocadiia bacterium]
MCEGCGCQKPEDVEVSPQGCSPEQASECHGETEDHPCVETACCENAGKLKGKPGDCSPEQIHECHGDATEHPCA